MDEWLPMSEVAGLMGINRNTIAAWVGKGKIKWRSGMVRNLKATLVNVAEVKALVAKGVGPGRPRTKKK